MDNKLLSIGETAKLLNVSIDTLRAWDKKNILNSFRPDPKGHRYYLQEDINNFLAKKNATDNVTIAKDWVVKTNPQELPSDLYCATVDVFTARLQSLNIRLEREENLKEIFQLVTAIIGEIGNNSFNHNLGNWPDIPGIFFGSDLKKREIVLADRGQGVLKSLQRVLPKLRTDSEALIIAFTKYISGRAPENRGNGLKFVKDIVLAHQFSLEFLSGNAVILIDKQHQKFESTKNNNEFHGSLAIINY